MQDLRNMNFDKKMNLTGIRLNTRALEFIDKAKLQLFYKSILNDELCKKYAWLNAIHDGGTLVRINNVKKELDTALTTDRETQYNMTKIKLWFMEWHEKKWYTRQKDYRVNEDYEKTFQQNVSQFAVDTLLYNRLYEMMCADLIKDLYKEEFPEYRFLVKKTSLYDDVMGGVDVIVCSEPKAGIKGERRYIGIDLISSIDENAVATKSQKKSTAKCTEFNYYIGKNLTMDRIVCNINPKISFMLLDRYLQAAIDGKQWAPGELLATYNEIWQAHEECHNWLDSNGKITINNVLENSREILKKAA